MVEECWEGWGRPYVVLFIVTLVPNWMLAMYEPQGVNSQH